MNSAPHSNPRPGNNPRDSAQAKDTEDKLKSQAMRTVANHALDNADRAKLLTMLGLATESAEAKTADGRAPRRLPGHSAGHWQDPRPVD